MWKTSFDGGYAPEQNTRPRISAPEPRRIEKPVSGQIITRVGNIQGGKVSKSRNKEHTERIPRIDDELLGYNLDGNRVLIRAKKNNRNFDQYISLPFTKGVTERVTGRTLLILGSNSHHGDAMLYQFHGVIWDEKLQEEMKRYGDTMRWINVGDTKSGFIGIDYKPAAKDYQGVAKNMQDVKFLATCLMEYGYHPEKKLFILKPPYIVESEEGQKFRKQGLEKLINFSK